MKLDSIETTKQVKLCGILFLLQVLMKMLCHLSLYLQYNNNNKLQQNNNFVLLLVSFPGRPGVGKEEQVFPEGGVDFYSMIYYTLIKVPVV